jgi:ADP-heptose:LPS heptosyltransferase
MEAFDEEINNTIDHSDLDKPNLYLHSNEVRTIRSMIAEAKQKSGKKKVLVFQPYGSGATLNDNTFVDTSSRSFEPQAYLKLAERLSRDFVIIFFGPSNLIHPNDKYSINVPTDDLRFFMAAISECDYFIGCDSVGQHMARAVGVPGTVIFGSTFPINTSYPDYFQCIDNGKTKKYSPIRIAGLDTMLSNRLNESTMKLNDKELNEIYTKIVADIEKKVK